MSKLKASAVVLVTFGMFAAGAGMLARGQAAKREEPNSPAAARNVDVKNRETDDDLVSNLAHSRVAIAKQIKNDMLLMYKAGEATLVDCLQCEKRVLDAQLDLSDDPADRIAILREHLKLSTQIENFTRQLFERDQKTRADARLATFNRLEAALRLAEAATGRKPSTRAPLKNDPIEEAKIQDLLNRFGTEQMTLAVQETLDRRITIQLPNPSSLSEVLKSLKKTSEGPFDSGAPIYVDPEGLKKAKASVETLVTVPIFSGTLKEALQKVLDPLGLSYSIRDGLIWITSK
jgi:hypothetical protein